MNIYEFMSAHPWQTFFLGFWVLIVLAMMVGLIQLMMRHANIRKHGYPPKHCDADGDFKPEKERAK